jgi:excisionase family DNA binding protein
MSRPGRLLIIPGQVADLAAYLDQMTGALKAAELGKIIGFEKSAIYQMAAEGRIPHYRIGPSIRFDPHVIARWLREREVKAA